MDDIDVSLMILVLHRRMVCIRRRGINDVGTIFDLPMPMMFMCVVMMMSGEAKNGYDFPIITKVFWNFLS